MVKKVVAVDGTKIRANSSRKNIHTKKGTEKDLACVEKKISGHMKELESNDMAEQSEPRLCPEVIQEVLSHLNKKKDKPNIWLKLIEENGGREISTIDPDARFMRQGGDGRNLDACYNVQTVVDFEVSMCPDEKGALPKMTNHAKEIMDVSEIAVVADRGCYDGDDLKESEQNGTTCYVPKMQNGKLAPHSRYDHKNFKYDKNTDSYTCPEDAVLVFQRTRRRIKGRTDRLYSNFNACQKCGHREKCWKNKSRRGREIFRSPNQDILDIVDARMLSEEARKIFRERKKIVEHPFGTVKKVWGYGQFLCRGQEKTTAEQSLTFLAYNFRRIFNISKEKGWDLAKMMV